MHRTVCLWSGPRNVSTALMYAFAERADTRAVDEPLYAHYLRVSGADHPGRDEVLAAQNQDGDVVMRDLLGTEQAQPVLFLKHMAHHLMKIDRGFLEQTTNALLVRDPREMLPSLVNQIPEPTLYDTGLAVQSELFKELRALGQDPVVVDSRALLMDPQSVLEELCQRLKLDFDPGMLSWPKGARPFDGVWAPHWYHGVHRSTGFGAYRPKSDPFPQRLEPLLAEALPHYEQLLQHALSA